SRSRQSAKHMRGRPLSVVQPGAARPLLGQSTHSSSIEGVAWWSFDHQALLMTLPQNEKAVRFRALHDGPGAFVIPNPWDIRSAQILAGLGFQALATSSGAAACTVGRRDGGLRRDEALAHARLIVEATDLPVSADLEKGFG